MIASSSFLDDIPLENVQAGTLIDTYELIGTTPQFFNRVPAKVTSFQYFQAEAFRLITASGIELVLGAQQQVVVINGGTASAQNATSNLIAVMNPNGSFRWERIASLTSIGVMPLTSLGCPNYFCASSNISLGFVLCSGT
jgi:hypothetical protein